MPGHNLTSSIGDARLDRQGGVVRADIPRRQLPSPAALVVGHAADLGRDSLAAPPPAAAIFQLDGQGGVGDGRVEVVRRRHRHPQGVAQDERIRCRADRHFIFRFAVRLDLDAPAGRQPGVGHFQLIRPQARFLAQAERTVYRSELAHREPPRGDDVGARILEGHGDSVGGQGQRVGAVAVLAQDGLEVDVLVWAIDGSVGIDIHAAVLIEGGAATPPAAPVILPLVAEADNGEFRADSHQGQHLIVPDEVRAGPALGVGRHLGKGRSVLDDLNLRRRTRWRPVLEPSRPDRHLPLAALEQGHIARDHDDQLGACGRDGATRQHIHARRHSGRDQGLGSAVPARDALSPGRDLRQSGQVYR